LRVFIAVDVDQPEMVQSLRALEEELSSLRVPMKLVEPENLHITIRFIGEVSDFIVGEIRSKVLPSPL